MSGEGSRNGHRGGVVSRIRAYKLLLSARCPSCRVLLGVEGVIKAFRMAGTI